MTGTVLGLRNKQIAARLSMAEATVRNHLHNACGKLGVSSRTEMALLVRHRGLV